MRRVSTVAVRLENRQTTIAIVSCNQSDLVPSDSDIQRQLIKAVTAWINGTEEGRQAWRDSSEDFNVADLANDLPEPSLDPYLKEHGIEELEIQIEGARSPYWNFDTVLCDSDPEEEDDDGD